MLGPQFQYFGPDLNYLAGGSQLTGEQDPLISVQNMVDRFETVEGSKGGLKRTETGTVFNVIETEEQQTLPVCKKRAVEVTKAAPPLAG